MERLDETYQYLPTEIELDIAGKLNHDQKIVKKLNVPFGYFGSKNRLALKLCINLPPHNCWVEAFGGSASLTFSKKIAPIEVVNDIDSDVVNLFRQIRDNHEELCKLVSLTPYSRGELNSSRISNRSDSDLERARKFLVQSMMAINGAFGKDRGGFSYSNSYTRNSMEARASRWYNLPERIAGVVERLRYVRIENKDARDLMDMFRNRPATLLYLDPPYLAKRSKGYNNDENNDLFHKELLTIANQSKCMIFISGYENPLYDQFLNLETGWGKQILLSNTRSVKGENLSRKEVVWMNKQFIKAQSTGRIPIRLSAMEKKHKKVNPERIY